MSEDLWFPYRRPRASARLRLFCFPYAGAGCDLYRGWETLLPEPVEVVAIQPPGRETRLFEPPFARMEPLVDALERAVAPLLDRPAAFFGHSLGALVMYELGRRFDDRLSCSFASACRAPHLPNPDALDLSGSPESVLAAVRAVYGIAEELVDDDFRRYLLPALVADLEIQQNYRPAPRERAPFPIVALGGARDETVTAAELAAWGELTRGPFRVETFAGDHFYLDAREPRLFACLRRELAAALR